MQATTLSFANLHNHGELFANVLRARRDHVVVRSKWDLPQTLDMQYDQYDTPQSRWLAVHDNVGRVLAGVRLTPTTAKCGIYSYMIRDAQRGLLEKMPCDVLDEEAPIDEGTWEVTRGFVSQDIPTEDRREVHTRLVTQMMKASREEGITRMLGLIPSNWHRWASRCLLDARPAGRKLDMGGIGYQAVWIDFSSQLH